ncbi:MAG: ferrous iron transport protein A [Saprospiraceae bacterium]|nr:ferrous iron transport protein A [Saprospiraceae bacterium]MBK6666647.1 ferrous iron transport protein A [Saprospiraceae bacterium]MBK8828270.1 ferrous iron transport protein A [Saprospiraceae bacterium]MBK9583048.1 ferrous iron transport protein A [Saprospiraceae bacterium]MBK9742763.1 ferrous iron transport protein A [Saprospiraceae bacterium]
MNLPKTLDSLQPGQSAYVSVLNENKFTCKLMNLGIMPKTKVTMVRKSPFGGAFYIKIDNIQMAMRESEANTIFIQDIV